MPALDGVRGIAIAGVLAFHGQLAGAEGGFLGVSTFFTLSGFLIGSLLIREYADNADVALSRFWARRFRRLMPAALMALLLISLYGAVAADLTQRWTLRDESLCALFYVANWCFIASGQSYADLFSTPSPVQHFWSLSIEEQYYAVFPLIVLCVLRWSGGSRRALAATLTVSTLISLALMVVLQIDASDPSRVYYGTDTRAAELLVGALAAIAFPVVGTSSGRRRRWIPLISTLGALGLLVLWSTASEAADWLYELGIPGNALASAAVIIGAAHGGPLRRVLSLPPLRWLGRISYGAYLYHWPLFLWLDADRTGLDGVALFAFRVGVTLILAELSHRWLESPIRTGSLLPGRRTWLAAGPAVAAVCAAVVLATAGAEPPAVILDAADRRVPVHRHDDQTPRLAIVGDSVALTLGSGLRDWGTQTGAALVFNAGNTNCGIARGGERVSGLTEHVVGDPCPDWSKTWPEWLDDFDPDVVIVLTGFWDLIDQKDGEGGTIRPGDAVYDDWLLSEYRAAADLLASRGASVVWLTTPCAGERLRERLVNPTGVDPERTKHLNENLLPRLVRGEGTPIRLVDLFARVCPNGAYASTLFGIPGARYDGLHFSRAGARRLGRWLGPLALEARADPGGG